MFPLTALATVLYLVAADDTADAGTAFRVHALDERQIVGYARSFALHWGRLGVGWVNKCGGILCLLLSILNGFDT